MRISSSVKPCVEHCGDGQTDSGPALKKLPVDQPQYGEVSTMTEGHTLPEGDTVPGFKG